MTHKNPRTIQLAFIFALLSLTALKSSAQSSIAQPRITQAVDKGTLAVSQSDRITSAMSSGEMVSLTGHVPRNAKPEYDQGRVESSFQLNDVTLLTLPSPSQQKALSRLVAEQQDPSSANYHKWLTPEQYADRFGLSVNDVRKISAWLESQDLSVASVARGRNWIVFSGTASQIERAFRTEIHHYNVNGKMHFANATPPSIPAALAGIAAGIRGLDDFHPRPMNVRKTPQARNARPNFSDNNFSPPDFVAPGDIATIYDLKPLYAAGIDGTGQKLVIVGQTDVFLSDLNNFRSGFGLAAISGCTTNSSDVITACNSSNFRYVLDGPDPGVSPPTVGDLTEADLDLEWSAATARGAQIIYVNSTDVFTSLFFAIDQNLAPVISMSFGECEFDANDLAADEVELTKSNSLGITFMNSSGDSGAAECDPLPTDPNNLATGGLAVSFPASSPEVTGVGGTAIPISEFTSTFWGTTNAPDGGTAISYIPEISWNDDVELVAGGGFGSTPQAVQENPNIGIESSGGGPSNCAVQTADFSTCVSGFPQPSWQTVTIPGQASARFSPDVSLLASPNFPGYIYCTQLSELGDNGTGSSCGSGGAAGILSALALKNPPIVGGTSVSTPIFAGIVTLLNQDLQSTGLGNINPMLYTLSKTTSNKAFHQVTTGTNVVFCEAGTPANMPASYRCPAAGSFGFNASNADPANGYNLVTGLGSVDANALFTAWKASSTTANFSLSVDPSAVTIASQGGSGATVLSVTGTNGYNGTITFSAASCSGLPAGSSCSFNPASVTGTGTTTLTISTGASGMLAPIGHQSAPRTRAGAGRMMLLFLCFAILWLGIQAGRRRLRWSAVASLLVLGCLIAVAACGGSSSSSNSSSSGGGGGNAVPQTVVVTASDGTNTNSVSFTLTID
jgi:subtilase family serine protease